MRKRRLIVTACQLLGTACTRSESQVPRLVVLRDRLCDIAEQRVLESAQTSRFPGLLYPRKVAKLRIDADAHHLNADVLKLLYPVAESNDLGRADEGEVLHTNYDIWTIALSLATFSVRISTRNQKRISWTTSHEKDLRGGRKRGLGISLDLHGDTPTG
jgi:hypothetical protein